MTQRTHRRRRDRFASDELLALFESTISIRRHLARTAGRGLPDIDAELALATWELIANGERNPKIMYGRLLSVVGGIRKTQARQQRNIAAVRAVTTTATDDPAELVCERVTLANVMAADPVGPDVQRWIDRRMGDADVRLTGAQYAAGRRWLRRQREAVGCVA